ncbi:uncharacterized protein [Diadema antillarum]|uniref:uncharacterized protein n=1 Tax=Diadema antillarum TaxID=105358 RepID=UPI003A8A58E8
MATDSKGGLITGYRNGRMEVFDGNVGRFKIQANISARDVGVLSDGRFVTLTRKNTLHMYESDGSPLKTNVTFDTEGEGFVAAIAVDIHDNIFLLLPEQALVVVFAPSGGRASSRLDLDCPIPSDVSEMTVSASGQILIVADDAVLTFDAEGSLCQRTDLARTERASCDRQGNLWVLSFHSVGQATAAQVMLHKYNGEDGSHIASSMVPTRQCRKGFDSWGIALSESSFAALIADNEIAFFALSRSEQ